jgi:hypothetical protein
MSAPQSCPQAPQFAASVILFTHFVPQTSGVEPPQLGRQVAGVLCSEHSGVAPLHTSEQLPQVAGVLRSASQPSSGFAEQCACPDAQALGGT